MLTHGLKMHIVVALKYVNDLIQCYNNLRGTEYSTTQEEWSSFIVAAVLELIQTVFEIVDTLDNIFVAVRFVVKSHFVVFVIGM